AHRIGAIVVLVYLLWLAHRVGRAGMRWHAVALAVVVIAQVVLGIAQVVLGLPLWVAAAHTAGAALLLFVVVALLVRTVSMRSSMIAASSGAAGHRAQSAMEDQNGLPWPDFPQQPRAGGVE
ncbi:MAG: COX15/CtaA family protein, partial [Rhodanobacteraceae bacterium]